MLSGPGARFARAMSALVIIITLANSLLVADVARGQGGPEAGLPEVNGWAIVAPLIEPRSEQAVAELDG